MSKVTKNINRYFHKKTLYAIIKGGFLYFSILLLLVLSISALAYYVVWSTEARKMLFIFASLCLVGGFFYLLIIPLFHYFKLEKDHHKFEKLALEIGKVIPEIKDKLVNYVQLLNSKENSSLQLASLQQRDQQYGMLDFTTSIQIKPPGQQLKFFASLVALFFFILVINPDILKEGSSRVINYQTPVSVPAPFGFHFEYEKNYAFRNEDFKIELVTKGEILPNDAFVEINERRMKLSKIEPGTFEYTISKLQTDINLTFHAAGFSSISYPIKVVNRPELISFNATLNYPAHTKLSKELKENTGNFIVPEGTKVDWSFLSQSTDSISVYIQNDSVKINSQHADNQTYTANYTFLKSSAYEVFMQNEYGENGHHILYDVTIIADNFPELDAVFYGDTIMYDFVVVTGKAVDDYGISKMEVVYEWNNEKSTHPIKVNPSATENSFFHRFDLNSLNGIKTDELRAYVNVWDNDGVNGNKRSQSAIFRFKMPGNDEIKESIDKKGVETEEKLNSVLSKTQSLNEQLEELEQRLMAKPNPEWQEEKLFNEILEQRQELEKQMEDLLSQIDELKEGQNKYNERSDKLKEKAEQLQKLMNEVLDEETKKLYEELQKLMQEKSGSDQIRDMLKEVKPNQKNMEKELERALELFKRLQLESNLEKAGKELEKLADEQRKLANEAKESDPSLAEKQEKINEEFEQIKDDLDKIREQNQELKNPEPLDNTQPDEDDITKTLDEIKKELEEKNSKSSPANKMKQGAEQMNQLGKKIASMQASMEMEMMQENISDLENILDNLIKLSFNQEKIMDGIRDVQQVDPLFVELSQQQLNLKDNAKIIEDSLLSLASRISSLSSFVTRELSEVNRNLDESIFQLRERNRSKAMSSQQFTMTSMNNLALLLSDLLKQMQMSMSEAMGKPKPGQKGNQDLPNLKQLQEQLSQQIQQIKENGKSGKELSEELARMAAEQEMLRNQLEEMKEQLGGQPGNEGLNDNLGKAIEQMELNEIDLVNKRLTQELINRQSEIMTRLLESEKAIKEQETEEEREGEKAREYEKRIPKAFEDYLKAREMEIELIKSVPLQLSPFYKKEVNDYFRRLSNQ